MIESGDLRVGDAACRHMSSSIIPRTDVAPKNQAASVPVGLIRT
jgi:hypothetical protein